MTKHEWILLVFIMTCLTVFLMYKHQEIVSSRGVIFYQDCENFSIKIFSKNGRNILVKEFNPSYNFFYNDEAENIKTAEDTIDQLGKMISASFGNGSICCQAKKRVILKNFTRQEVIKQMVKFVAENQEKSGCSFLSGREPEKVCEKITYNYNTGL